MSTTATTTGQTFRLPDLGEGLSEAAIVRWLVAVGDEVGVDEAIVEVETAKSVVEVPSPYAGLVTTLHASEGETVSVGGPLITIGPVHAAAEAESSGGQPAGDETGSGSVLVGYGTAAPAPPGRRRRPRQSLQPAQPEQPEQSRQPRQPEQPGAIGPARVISPVVRDLARAHGVDLAGLTGSGPDGVINRADVEAAIERGPARNPSEAPGAPARGATASVVSAPGVSAPVVPAPRIPASGAPGERRTPLSGFRRAAAAALSRSRAEIPEATVWVDVDATPLWELREAGRTAADPGPGLLAYLARFVVAGLRSYPMLNASIDTERDELVEYERIHLGIAVQGERGLVVPAVLDAGSLTTHELDRKIRDVTQRARVGRVSPEELTAGTFTLNNYGGFRVDGSAAIINHPQVAILGLGRILDRPWVVDGELAVRKITQMSFVFDHRVCDGATAAGFMRSVADAIENPASAIARL